MKYPDDNSISSDLSRIATVLKEHFSSVRGPYLANKLPTIQHNYFDFFLNVTHTTINSFAFDLVVSDEVKLKSLVYLMESLMVYILVFKCSENFISSILAQIINLHRSLFSAKPTHLATQF